MEWMDTPQTVMTTRAPAVLTNHLSVETQDPLAEVNMFTGMSKFAKIAWSLTR